MLEEQNAYYPQDMPPMPQPMPGSASDALYADYAQERKVENILTQINPDNLLTDIEHRIKGEKKDPYTQQWIPIAGAVKVSDELVGNFITFLNAFLNNNTTFSNLRDKEINNIMNAVIEWVTDDLKDNGGDKYGFGNNYSQRTKIGLIICGTVFMTLKRAQNGLEAQRAFRVIKIGENNNPYAQEKGGSMVDALKFWK